MNTINITEKEYISAILLNRSNKTSIITTICSVPIFYIIINLWPNSITIGGVFGAAAGIAFYWIKVIFITPWQAAKFYQQHKTAKDKFQISWDSEEICIKHEKSFSSIPWSNYLYYKDNKNVINIYFSDVSFQIIPKKIFTSIEMKEEFYTLMKKNLIKNK